MKKTKVLMSVLCLVFSFGLLFASGQQESGDSAKPVELNWYYIGGDEPNQDEVFAAANEIIKEEIGAVVNFHRFSFGDYPKKMQLKIAAGEEIDLLFAADWSLNYNDIVTKGALIPLDQLVKDYAPGTNSLIPEKIWNGTRINGEIYGVPNYQVSFRQHALIFNKELVDKYDLKDKIFAIEKMGDLTPIFQIIKDNEPNIYPTAYYPDWQKMDVRSKDQFVEVFVGMPCGVDYDLNIVDTNNDRQYLELQLEDYKLAREWNEKGFYHPDVAIAKDLNPEKAAGKFFMLNDVYKPGIEADMKNRYGYDVYAVPMGIPVLSTGSITATLTSISRTSKNSEKAMELIELMNTNVELYNMIVFGLEGKQYNMVSENQIELIPDSGYSGFAWMMGSQFNAYFMPGQSTDAWEMTKRLNSEAYAAPTLGFSFDANPVKTEIANIKSATKSLVEISRWGLVPVDEFIELRDDVRNKVNTAGLDTFKAELQSQIDAWVAASK